MLAAPTLRVRAVTTNQVHCISSDGILHSEVGNFDTLKPTKIATTTTTDNEGRLLRYTTAYIGNAESSRRKTKQQTSLRETALLDLESLAVTDIGVQNTMRSSDGLFHHISEGGMRGLGHRAAAL